MVSRLTETRLDRLSFGRPMRLVLEDVFVDESGDRVVGWACAPDGGL